MSRTVSNAARVSMMASSTSEVFLVLLEIDHAELAAPIRLVNNTVNITSNGDVYLAGNFKFTPPVEEDGSIRSASLTMGNVDRALVEAIRSISSAPSVQCSIIRAADPDTIEAGPWEFFLRGVSYDALTVSGELVPDNPLRRNISVVNYRNTTFPGLYG